MLLFPLLFLELDHTHVFKKFELSFLVCVLLPNDVIHHQGVFDQARERLELGIHALVGVVLDLALVELFLEILQLHSSSDALLLFVRLLHDLLS